MQWTTILSKNIDANPVEILRAFCSNVKEKKIFRVRQQNRQKNRFYRESLKRTIFRVEEIKTFGETLSKHDDNLEKWLSPQKTLLIRRLHNERTNFFV